MSSKFLKDPTNNPFDWFNINGKFEHIFSDNKNFTLDGNEVKVKSDINYIINETTITCIVGDEIGEFSKFHFLVKIKFKGNSGDALSYVKYELQKNEFPFIRVGVDYYKKIKKTNRYDAVCDELKLWIKTEIKQDYKNQFHLVKYYDDFTFIPDNINYRESISGLFNQYPRFPHKQHNAIVEEKDIPVSLMFLQHIFGEQYDLGLKYMKILYENPKQSQYILCLVSVENNTGKSTFIDWIEMIFGHAAIQIAPENLTSNFNSIYSTKNIIMIEEAVTEKVATVEKLKALATQKNITVNKKNVSEYSIPFFGKFILCTNKEKEFIKINEKETRFWVRKIKEIVVRDTTIEFKLREEIPKFLKYLSQQPEIDFSKHRMVFLPEEIYTENLEALKEESKSGLYKELDIHLEDFFNENIVNEFYANPTDIKNKWFKHNNQVSINYIRKVLKDEFNLKSEKIMKYSAFETEVSKTGTPFKFSRMYFGNA